MVASSQPRSLDDTLTALADPTRRAILETLSGGEARVTALAEPFALSLNAVSKHIRVLERAQLVRRRRAGREHFLTLNPQPLDEAVQWMEAQRSLWLSRLQKLDQLLQAQDAGSASPAAKPPKTTRRKGLSR